MPDTALPTYKPKDFASNQDVRWCPGCGDYAVLKAVQKTLPSIKKRKEDYVFISGIGCAARFPYYMDTYGMHTIHGRAPAFAVGVKVANPQLDVWIVSGDGDLFSIGGNHTLHAMRRNLDINLILLNNRIYGLTKGQYSPTSEFGKRTKSTPMGSLDFPVHPLTFAVGVGCSFVARTIDIDVKHLDELMQQGAAHRGTSFIEVYQDCNIFNHKTWFYASQKEGRAENTVLVEHGKPLVFGADRDKGLRWSEGKLEVVQLGNGATEDDCIIHDETDRNLAYILAQMSYPDYPEPLGIIHRNPDCDTYDRLVAAQIERAIEDKGEGDLQELLFEGDTWEVK